MEIPTEHLYTSHLQSVAYNKANQPHSKAWQIVDFHLYSCVFCPADIDKILSRDIKLPHIVECFEVWLLVRGLEDWIDKASIAEHFEAEANGAKIEYIELDKEGTEARIMFIDPQGNDER